ncbi:MAG: precorrin-6y C5,15-methyltransferase (decarboxylating) subunit CbiE [Desulfobacterales bacterium]|nr:precorrin-6y C5,15-methyltransferase (decarboxylating) subunit CbiE [Desulfobacterales bacterium]
MTAIESPHVDVIGMGMSPRDLTDIHLQMISAAQILIGGKRHLASFPDVTARRVAITHDLLRITELIAHERGSCRIVVLASGDPLYYGIGAYLIRTLGRDRVRIWPNINTVAAAAARIGKPWQDTTVVSLHGRDQEHRLIDALNRGSDLAVFTDAHHSPAWLAETMLKNGHGEGRMCVLERLGYPEERVRWFDPQQARGESFQEPNLVVIETDGQPVDKRPYLGIPENDLDHERSLITKSEVRAVTLSKLRLKAQMVLWDLGAGSGAVAIEACGLIPGGQILAVEKNHQRADQIRSNCSRFGASAIRVIEAELPAGLEALPAPDRVFIGGGGQALAATIENAAGRLKTGGLMVVNTVLLGSLNTALAAMKRRGLKTDVTQIQISRSRPMPTGERLEALNPVWIVRGSAPASKGNTGK